MFCFHEPPLTDEEYEFTSSTSKRRLTSTTTPALLTSSASTPFFVTEEVAPVPEETKVRPVHFANHLQSLEEPPTSYAYPPKMRLPLPECFHNPTGRVQGLIDLLGYVCCNPVLNNLMEDTYQMIVLEKKFHTCNLNQIANTVQVPPEPIQNLGPSESRTGAVQYFF